MAPPDEYPEGAGDLYEVVCATALVRVRPCQASLVQTTHSKGDFLELFEWDDSRRWRAWYDRYWNHVGWMRTSHPDGGTLLRPCSRIMSAVHSGACWESLQTLIRNGHDIDYQNVEGATPLMLASAQGRADLVVVLLGAGADLDLRSLTGASAVELASGQTKALVCCLSGEAMDESEVEAAVQELPGELQSQVSFLLTTAAAKRALRQAIETSWEAPSDEAPDCAENVLLNFSNERGKEAETRGEMHRVVASKVWIRDSPSVGGHGISLRVRGQVVEMFEFDATRRWRRVETGTALAEVDAAVGQNMAEPVGHGWMLLMHTELGMLMQPVDSETSCGVVKGGQNGGATEAHGPHKN